MTSERGPVVPGGLRQTLVRQLGNKTAMMYAEAGPVVDLLLAEIAASGHSIVATGQYDWPIHTNAGGLPDISVVCENCGSQYYWPLNANGELELSPSQMECECDLSSVEGVKK